MAKEPKVSRNGWMQIQRDADGRLVARDGVWELFELPKNNSDGWVSLKLYRFEPAQKNTWYLGWNGERFARNRSAAMLEQHQPQIAQWVEASLRQQANGEQANG